MREGHEGQNGKYSLTGTRGLESVGIFEKERGFEVFGWDSSYSHSQKKKGGVRPRCTRSGEAGQSVGGSRRMAHEEGVPAQGIRGQLFLKRPFVHLN